MGTSEGLSESAQVRKQFLEDLGAVLPYIEAALESGTPVSDILASCIEVKEDRTLAVSFPGFARMMASVQIRFDLNEDGTSVTRTNFTDFSHTAEAE